MSKRTVFFVVGALMAATGRIASANPIMCEVFHARQTPLTQHVQITFADDCAESFEVLSVKRDGEALDGAWSSFQGYTTNTGSGLRELAALQLCDCALTTGAFEYAIEARSDDRDVAMSLTVKVVPAEEVPEPDPDEEDTDTYEMAWDIPDPVEMQGLDCAATCAEDEPASTDAEGDAAGDDTESSATKETEDGGDPEKETAGDKESDSGCTVIGRIGRSSDVSMLFVLGFIAIVIWRFRRNPKA
jgi:hypothetical protein